MQIYFKDQCPNTKLGDKGCGLGHVTYFVILVPPLYMRQKAEATSFKFDTQIDYKEYTFEMVVSKS